MARARSRRCCSSGVPIRSPGFLPPRRSFGVSSHSREFAMSRSISRRRSCSSPGSGSAFGFGAQGCSDPHRVFRGGSSTNHFQQVSESATATPGVELHRNAEHVGSRCCYVERLEHGRVDLNVRFRRTTLPVMDLAISPRLRPRARVDDVDGRTEHLDAGHARKNEDTRKPRQRTRPGEVEGGWNEALYVEKAQLILSRLVADQEMLKLRVHIRPSNA